MKVSDLLKEGYKSLTGTKGLDKEIKGVYICDLLSWVMSHAKTGDAWLTVQVHSNIVAVALLTEVACIIVPEGIEVNKDTLERAIDEGVPILSTEKSSYDITKDIARIGGI